MAHPSKFVSVNLNKSYGQPPSSLSSAHGRARPVAHSGSGGMVVLSRPRSSSSAGPKVGSKLSVPPPLNLPSLRKEHERFDSGGGSGPGAGAGGAGSGSGSSSMGWTKPGLPLADAAQKGAGPRPAEQPVAASAARAVEKAVVLKGEDFPSLLASFASPQKQKDSLKQKQEQGVAKPEFDTPLHMRPQMRTASPAGGSVSDGAQKQSQKLDGALQGPLPIIRLSHTSDWADDERDTGLGILERERDHGFSRAGSSDGRAQRDAEAGGGLSRDLFRGDLFGRDLNGPSKDGRDIGSWRTPQQQRDGFGGREMAVSRDGIGARTFCANGEINKESSFGHLDGARDGFSNGMQDYRYARRDFSSVMNNQNGYEQNVRGRYGDFSSNRLRGDAFTSGTAAKDPFSSPSKGFSLKDPILNFGREKRISSNAGKSYLEGPGFDSSDPFSGDLIGDVNVKLFKRKKDVKQTDFHDPVRESFEAELERVQRMQEQQRQRVLEEQARALELARKEEEERERLAREEEERRRRLEKEAREAAWRVEQERLVAVRRAEELKIAREEEKRRILVEEERRKEAARQKLMELEARIAKRQAEVALKDDKMPPGVTDEQVGGLLREMDALRATDTREWEDTDRVEHVASSASSESFAMHRSFDTGSHPQSSKDGGLALLHRGKPANYWKRDAYDNGNNSMFFQQDQPNGYHSPCREAFGSGRAFTRAEYCGSPGSSGRPLAKGGAAEPVKMPDDLRFSKGDGWNMGDGDRLNRHSDVDSEFLENDKFCDGGWGPSPSRGRPHSPYGERLFQNPDMDGFTAFGRSRYSMRQPRVPPPPSVSSIHRRSFRAPAGHPSSSSYIDSESRYHHLQDREQEQIQTAYHNRYHEALQGPETNAQQDKAKPRCDSQSSLSVSSAPSSPSQPSHDDIDESGETSTRSSTAIEEQTVLTDNEHIVSLMDVEDVSVMVNSASVSRREDEEWTVENTREIQEPDEYDEEGDGYQEQDEAHEGDDENLDLSQDYEDLQADVQNTANEVGQLVLGFDEGVEMEIPSNDDVQDTFRDGENVIGTEDVSVGTVTDLMSAGLGSLQTESAFPQEIVNSSADLVNETEKTLQKLVLDQESSSSQSHNNVETFSSSGMPSAQQFASPSLPVSSSLSVKPILSSVSTVATQAEAPPKLPFGLFSGPSLIPSPVPAIQIGSIQMPLQLHPHVGPSVTQMRSSQPTFLQFGQLRYQQPISQGVLPLPAQTLSFVQPAASAHYPLNQNHGGSVHKQLIAVSASQHNLLDGSSSVPLNKQPVSIKKPFDLPQENLECLQSNTLMDPSVNDSGASQVLADNSSLPEQQNKMLSVSPVVRQGVRNPTVKKNYRPVANKRESQAQMHVEPVTSQFLSGEKAASRPKYSSVGTGGRGKRHSYTARATGSRSSFPGSDASQANSVGFQRRGRRKIRRTEFRVRGIIDGRQADGLESYAYPGREEKSNGNESVSGARYTEKNDNVLNASSSTMAETENIDSGASGKRIMSYNNKMAKISGRVVELKRTKFSLGSITAGAGTSKRSGIFEENVDAPLQTGVVRIFEQPGIETPSDEDDFIEVRSKRQMLNHRREQREKEIQAKSRAMKAPRKPATITQNIAVISNSTRAMASSTGDAGILCSDPVVTSKRLFGSVEPSPVYTANMASQMLPPIGTPAQNGDSVTRTNSAKSCQTTISAISSSVKLVPSLPTESKIPADTAPAALGSWVDTDPSQQVIALTQTQLDEAMKPVPPDSNVTSSVALEPAKNFSSSTSPLTSLLAGEKIQFGAVTSPSILPPVIQSVSNGVGPPGSKRADVLGDHCSPATHNNCSMFFDKEKHPEGPCAHLEDPDVEAEAEAAASAVAVAAISSNDEMIGSRPVAATVSISDSKTGGLSSGAGGTANQEVSNQSAGEESLTVSLPADLSVDTSSLSLWPPLASPQSSSGPVLSHFPGAPASHFPCFEMNPILGAPIFAFGSPDESASTQAQPQRSAMLGSAPPGAWSQCLSGVDSFYGPPAGFSGPFISPGGIPGVQGPPQMVVYNHFTPVGQFGQVGLSFMGTTYIPTGKQPDWKHNPSSSTGSVGEDVSNLNVASSHRNVPSMPPIQHVTPGSPLMPMPSPLAMFDMTPFQSSAEVPMQARWSHTPAPSPLHAIPLTVPLQQHQVETGLHPQFSCNLPMDSSIENNRFSESRSSTPADGNLLVQGDTSPSFPSELILVNSSLSSTSTVQTIKSSYTPTTRSNNKEISSSKNSTINTISNPSDMGAIGTTSSQTDGQSAAVPSSKSQSAQQLNSTGSQELHSGTYPDHRGGGPPQKNSSGSEWHRRVGFHGRNQSLGSDKNFASAKVKQIYVAKHTANGPANHI